MQSCSIHHCVLFFITLTFTTAPVSAVDCPVLAKLHQPVTLPCEHECPALAKWTLDSTRDVVFAQCNQTSCSSLKEGYEMSHDQYLKGVLSLTITAADYSMSNMYTCECRDSDIVTVRLKIDTVFSAVRMSPGEDLILDVSVPESAVVIYKSRNSADGEQICTVTQTQHSQQCKAEYTPRISLSYPELTLRGVQKSDSGSYIIHDTENERDIHVYAVSVTGLTDGEIVAIVLVVLLLLLVISIVMIYMKRAAMAADKELKEVESRMKEVDDLMEQVRLKNPAPENQNSIDISQINQEHVVQAKEVVEKAENKINDLEEQYKNNTNNSRYVELFCENRKTELRLYKNLFATVQRGPPESETGEVMEMMEEVVSILGYFRYHDFKLRHSTDPKCMYLLAEGCLYKIKSWYMKQRKELIIIKQQPNGLTGATTTMETLLEMYEQWHKDKEKKLDEYREKLKFREGPNQHATPAANREEEESTPLNIAV